MGKRIRVLVVGLDTHLGGIETYILKICSNIDRNRFDFGFLAYDDEKPCFFDELSQFGFKFYYVRSRRTSFFGNIKDIRELYKKEHFDIIHDNLNSLTYITPIIEGVRKGIPVVAISHNSGAANGSSSKILGLVNRLRFPYSKVTLAAVSDKAGNWMFGERKTLILNNGLDTSLYRFSEEKRENLRRELSLGNKEVIIHVGAFRSQKNHAFLIDIFNEYLKRNKDAVLLLVGEGELKEEIERKVRRLGISDCVLFLGKRDDIPSLLSASDKFLFPSLYEGFPNALIEAETAGLWCVVASTITKEAQLGNSTSLNLDESLPLWCDALSRKVDKERESYADLVEEHGFGIKDDMKRIENLYIKMSEKNNE